MNKLKKLLRAKRAFSVVIASLILMLLSVAAGVVVYSYVMGWLGGNTATAGGTQGRLQFDSVRATASDDVIKIYVRNVGSKDLTLNATYVEGTQFANESTTFTPSLTIGSLAYLQVDTTGTTDLTKGYYYEVKVTCTDGTTVSQSVEAK